MNLRTLVTTFCIVGLITLSSESRAEVLGMMNYESKMPDQLKSLKLGDDDTRREGIAIIDLDPDSQSFGKIVSDIPISPDNILHHIYYDRTMTKAYITGLSEPSLQVMDMTSNPFRIKTVDVKGCVMAENVIFDEANENWYLTCMDSANFYVGKVTTDEITAEVKVPNTYPHGLGIHTGIDRIIVTSTVSGDLKTPDDIVTILRASDLEVLGKKKLSLKEGQSGDAPAEVLFVPGANIPTAYVTTIFGGTLWALIWDEKHNDFTSKQVYDFSKVDAGMALEMYFNKKGDRLYVTTATPGHLHVFDIANDPASPQLITSIPTAEGAHHVGITKDEKYAFVQNSFLNLPGLSDGSVTVIDLNTHKRVRSMDTLKDAGFNPNSIILLPEWNSFGGH